MRKLITGTVAAIAAGFLITGVAQAEPIYVKCREGGINNSIVNGFICSPPGTYEGKGTIAITSSGDVYQCAHLKVWLQNSAFVARGDHCM